MILSKLYYSYKKQKPPHRLKLNFFKKIIITLKNISKIHTIKKYVGSKKPQWQI